MFTRVAESTELTVYKVDSATELRCAKGDASLSFCGSCASCILKSKLSATSEWFRRAGDVTKKRFLTGIIKRCESLDLLQNIENVLKATMGKDFTYSRSRANPSLPQDVTTWGSDRALDPKVLGKDMLETWDWFKRSGYWSKANYMLGLLVMCDAEILHVAGNLIRVLVVRQKKNAFSRKSCGDHQEDETASLPESHYTFRTDQHPELDLLMQACPGYEPVTKETFPSNWGQESEDAVIAEDSSLGSAGPVDSRQLMQGPWTGEGQGRLCTNSTECSDEDSVSSDHPALMIVPTSFQSTSGVSRYRDFLRGLPVHLAKCILGFLDKHSLVNCLCVSQFWRFLAEEVQKEVVVCRMVQNEAMILQGSSPKGISAVYAKICNVPVPMSADDGSLIPVLSIGKPKDSSLEAVYAGLQTKAEKMEERNVYCGSYNVLVLSDHEDPSRTVHYNGRRLLAIGSKDRKVRILDVVKAKEVPPTISGHAGSVIVVFICEQRGVVISAGYDLSIRCWNINSGDCMKILRGHLGTIGCLDLYENSLVSGAKDCKVKVWNILTGNCINRCNFKHKDPIVAVKINREYVLSSCKGGLVKLWHIATGNLIKTLQGHQGEVKGLYFDDWHIFSGGEDGYVKAWSMHPQFNRCLRTFRHPKEVTCLAFRYLRLISGCADGKIRIFNFLTGDCLREMRANSRSNPVLSINLSDNSIVLNTQSSVLLFQFAQVEWDYKVQEVVKLQRRDYNLTPALKKHSYPYVRAQRMKRVGSTNQKIYHRGEKELDTADAGLSHHARSLSANKMQRAQSIQKESMRPATWNELQSYRRSMAYIDLQPEFFTKPPSVLEPGRPFRSISPEPQSRASHAPDLAKESGRGSSLRLARSEHSVLERVRKRGPHGSITPERLLLSVSTLQRSQKSDENTERNSAVRDAWGSLSSPQSVGKLTGPTKKHPKTPADPTSLGRSVEMVTTYTPLVTKGVELKLGNSFYGSHVKSSIPKPSLVRPQSCAGFGEPRKQGAGKKRPQSTSGVQVQEIGSFTTTAEELLQMTPNRMGIFRTPTKQVTFKEASVKIESPKQRDPYREHSMFRLWTAKQEKQACQHSLAEKKETDDRDAECKRAWLMKVKGLPIADFTKDGQVAAPELGYGVYI
ncbi:F-box/WD repeat-containing protein 10 [Acipenser ruthenus]|uniref:F-box/WD repeat-containing protein 10 n=1 Tax=Acipenser ruthenus TaxID=7906 RepID=A0A662Z165_ACIRT|nr:F-box/WD repeat-containing protein 10 [Acipenser ruthenus]